MNILKNDLIKLVGNVATEDAAAFKYAEHLYELLCEALPERISTAYAHAVECGDAPRALRLLAEHFRAREDNLPEELSSRGAYNKSVADDFLRGRVSVVGVDWEFTDGQIDYLFDPTEIKPPVNYEWLWQFNRHREWSEIARAYRDTGDETYAKFFNTDLLRWIRDSFIPDNWNGARSTWRTLECGLRLLGSWQRAFDGFKRSTSVSDIALLLMVASMIRQAKHLIEHPTGKNWLVMESNGVFTFSALFSELRCSAEMRRISLERLTAEISGQILPDGMHNELSPDYQLCVFNCGANIYELCLSLGIRDALPDGFEELLKSTVRAAVRLSTPAFTQPSTNDTFTVHTETFTARAERLFGQDPLFSFVNTKRGEAAPQYLAASDYLPYAGFAVMRSDLGEDAAYLCFDVGPIGRAHCHQDKLNIILFKGKRQLLYDDGGGQYDISPQRLYAISGYAHNVVLVDGLPQLRGEPLVSCEPIDAAWVSNSRFDYAKGLYDDGFADGYDGGVMNAVERAPLAVRSATHLREIRFEKPGLFIVRDTLTSRDGKPHDYELLFHLDTDGVDEIWKYRNAVATHFGDGYELAMIPLDADENAILKTYHAVKEPKMQGWYNGRNDEHLHEALTVSRTVPSAVDYVFTTLLIPFRSGGEMPSIMSFENGRVAVRADGVDYEVDLLRLDS